MIWFIFGWADIQPDLVIENTDIYQALTRSRVAVAPARIFILNAKGQEIKAYSRTGEPLGRIARPGQGPGELSQTNRIAFVNGTLFAISPFVIQTYDGFGNFIGKMIRPNRMGGMYKMANGWVSAPFKYTPETAKIVFLDETLENQKEIERWETGAYRKRINGTVFNLQNVYSQMVIKTGGRNIFLWRSDQSTILQVYDATSLKLTANISIDVLKEGFRRDLMVVPDYHPKPQPKKKRLQSGLPELENFGFLAAGPGELVYWFPPERKGLALVVDGKGRQYQAEFTPYELRRIAAEEDDLYYIVIQNPDSGELGLVRLHKSHASAFMKANPVDLN